MNTYLFILCFFLCFFTSIYYPFSICVYMYISLCSPISFSRCCHYGYGSSRRQQGKRQPSQRLTSRCWVALRKRRLRLSRFKNHELSTPCLRKIDIINEKMGPWLFRVCRGWNPAQLYYGDYIYNSKILPQPNCCTCDTLFYNCEKMPLYTNHCKDPMKRLFKGTVSEKENR